MKNLVIAFKKVGPESLRDGLAWYQTANSFCQSLAGKYALDCSKVCAILSALSPATNYEQNKKDTEGLIRLLTGRIQSYTCTTYGPNVRKARAIFEANDNYIQFFNLKTGPKTYNFFLNVSNPIGNEVTIDRHAYRIATGLEYKHLTVKQYDILADHYRKAAKVLGILPLELQAVLWIDYRVKQEIAFKEYQTIDCPF